MLGVRTNAIRVLGVRSPDPQHEAKCRIITAWSVALRGACLHHIVNNSSIANSLSNLSPQVEDKLLAIELLFTL